MEPISTPTRLNKIIVCVLIFFILSFIILVLYKNKVTWLQHTSDTDVNSEVLEKYSTSIYTIPKIQKETQLSQDDIPKQAKLILNTTSLSKSNAVIYTNGETGYEFEYTIPQKTLEQARVIFFDTLDNQKEWRLIQARKTDEVVIVDIVNISNPNIKSTTKITTDGSSAIFSTQILGNLK
ncbi:MAG: hypothetical protein V4473_00285 [Patescibacteria group bacterium]